MISMHDIHKENLSHMEDCKVGFLIYEFINNFPVIVQINCTTQSHGMGFNYSLYTATNTPATVLHFSQENKVNSDADLHLHI